MTTEETLAQWNQQLETVRATMRRGGGRPGIATPAMVADKNGLEFMQDMLAGAPPYPHISETLDFMLVEFGAGKAVFQGTPQLRHFNPLGSVHGGWYTCLVFDMPAAKVA